MNDSLIVRQLNQTDYTTVWHAMQSFTDNRNDETLDEIWLVEHPAVFTQGQAGKEEHILSTSNIPIVKVDRGGQVTYHGPGQQVLYVLINLRRRKMGVRNLVTLIENAIIGSLNDYGITAVAKPDAPGVYIDNKKVASLGLRVRKGCSFHGLALNVNMDLSPFLLINPCGYAGLEMVQTSTLNGPKNVLEAGESLVKHISTLLNSNTIVYKTGLETLNDN
ncbi:lipoyl(octanoyl) transferase LipB [Pseudocolwellia agarivorans]|uniref:lipoyl(octanoyl) transferase LipB n=1 Tax=Pseudocolwellia agarivorans TaxID=1911682 RepID=UPI0009877489|nr:lipoyl(octanoyl) transferase LipB [Pseudocolwellia agarivorans]